MTLTTAFCVECGAPAEPDASYCTSCGSSLPVQHPRPRRLTWRSLIALGVVVVLIVVGAAIVIARWSAEPTTPTVAPAPPSVPTAPPYSPPTFDPPPSPSPDEVLAAYVARDAGRVDGLSGTWVPQIASKSVGGVFEGRYFGPTEIVIEHQSLRATYPDAVILTSGRFPTFRSPGFYVTVVAIGHGTPAEANAWCDDAGLPATDCFAKLLADDVGNGPTIVTR